MSDAANMELSILRTNLSNTRTMLSHTKASIGLIISALGFMTLFDSYLIFDLCGWFFIFLALVVFVKGILHFRRTKSRITEVSGRV